MSWHHTQEAREKIRQGKLGEKNPNWRGDNISAREMSYRLYKELGNCQYPNCPEPARERHHKDGNVENNKPDNVQFLCSWHHHLIDGRLEKLAKQAKERDRTGEYHHTLAQQKAHKERGANGLRDKFGRFITK